MKVEIFTSARAQHRAAFKQMALGGTWHLYASPSGVCIDKEGADWHQIVPHVEAMTEDTMALKMNDSLLREWPEIWGAK